MNKNMEYLADAAATAVMSLMVSWLQDGLSFTPRQMSEKCRSLIAAILSIA